MVDERIASALENILTAVRVIAVFLGVIAAVVLLHG